MMSLNGVDLLYVVWTAVLYWTVLNIINRLGYIWAVWAMVGGIALSILSLGWMQYSPWHPDHAFTIVATAAVLWGLTLFVRWTKRSLKKRS
ncbi:MAG: hypothetical protein K9G59_02575 [Caulobacter sp.]|nr:hypothetical protein [Caulobacter sp.]